MGRTKGTYTLTSNIEPKVGAPLDARTIVKLLADLTASNTFEYPYKGMKVFVEENNKSYTLVGSDPTVSTNWIEDNSGGHTIKNPAGTAMTQRSNLQFVDLTISDDSTNDATKVESVHVIHSESELDNLPDGLYMLDEDEDTVIDGNLVGYDNTTSGLNAENVQDAIDEVVETLDDKIDISVKGAANGVAELDSAGKVPSSQLPSFVDDVLEYASSSAFPATGETGKIYVALDTNKTYRWGGTEYVEISESLALGETSSTAYRGDRGKTAYDHSQVTSGNPHNVTKSEVGLGNVDNTSDSTKKTNFTGSIASGDTGFTTGGDVYTALGGKSDKVSSATNGNLAGLNGSGNLTDSGWNGAKDTTSISGNPISISGLKANQLAVNPIITLEPIQDLHGQSKPYPAGGGKNKFNIGWVYTTSIFSVSGQKITKTTSAYNADLFSGNTGQAQPSAQKLYLEAGTYTLSYTSTESTNIFVDSIDSSTLVPNGGIATSCPSGGGTSFTVSTDSWVCLKVTSNLALTISNLQIESGSPATSYAPYENICPISGYDKIEVLSCGVNVWDEEWEQGGISIINGQDISITDSIRSQNYCLCLPNTSYYMRKGGNSDCYVFFYDSNKNYINNIYSITSQIISSPINARYFKVRASISNSIYNHDISINYPSTDTSYHASNKATSISESLGQTVYGGTLDVRTGKFTVTWAKVVFDGTERWTKNNSSDTNYLYWVTLTSVPGHVLYYQQAVKSDKVEGKRVDDTIIDVGIALHNTNSMVYYVNLGNVIGTNTVEGFKTYLANNPLEVCYMLETPFTIQLTPHEISILKDYAYVSTNGTNIALDYHNGELASLGDVSQLGETVNELEDYVTSPSLLNGLIHSKEITVTTNASGLANINMDSRKVCIINMFIKSNTTVHYIALVDIYQINSYIVKALNGADLTPVADQSITIVVYYYDLA